MAPGSGPTLGRRPEVLARLACTIYVLAPFKKSPEQAAYLLSFAIAVTAAGAAAPLVARLPGIVLVRPQTQWAIFASTFGWAALLCYLTLLRKKSIESVLTTSMGFGVLNVGTSAFVMMMVDRGVFADALGAAFGGILCGFPIGAICGFVIGVGLLPFLHFARSLHGHPSHDGYTFAAWISAALFFLVGLLASCDTSLIRVHEVLVRADLIGASLASLITSASLATFTFMSDLSLARFLSRIQRGETDFGVTYDLDQRANANAPILSVVRGSFGALLTDDETVGVGPFREAKQALVVAWIPGSGLHQVRLRLITSALLFSAAVLTIITLVSP